MSATAVIPRLDLNLGWKCGSTSYSQRRYRIASLTEQETDTNHFKQSSTGGLITSVAAVENSYGTAEMAENSKHDEANGDEYVSGSTALLSHYRQTKR